MWVRLDSLIIRDPETPTHVIGAGVNMTGEVPGLLTHWVPTAPVRASASQILGPTRRRPEWFSAHYLVKISGVVVVAQVVQRPRPTDP